jgi:hypothetical protein
MERHLSLSGGDLRAIAARREARQQVALARQKAAPMVLAR